MTPEVKEALKETVNNRKSIRGLELELELRGFGWMMMIGLSPLVWRKWLFCWKTAIMSNGGFHLYIGPFHIWSMKTDRMFFGIAVGICRNWFWWDKPKKPGFKNT